VARNDSDWLGPVDRAREHGWPISPGALCWEMWGLATVCVETCHFPHLAKNERDMGLVVALPTGNITSRERTYSTAPPPPAQPIYAKGQDRQAA
jgi:hypothetical protein